MELLSPPEYEISQRSKVCGVDVHKQFFVAALLSQSGGSTIKRFQSDKPGLLEFKDWVLNEECELVALESTGIYWYSLYSTLEDHIEVTVANPYLIKNIPGRKTDIADVQWIAQLALNDLIKPSRIFPKKQREIRNLTRSVNIWSTTGLRSRTGFTMSSNRHQSNYPPYLPTYSENPDCILFRVLLQERILIRFLHQFPMKRSGLKNQNYGMQSSTTLSYHRSSSSINVYPSLIRLPAGLMSWMSRSVLR